MYSAMHGTNSTCTEYSGYRPPFKNYWLIPINNAATLCDKFGQARLHNFSDIDECDGEHPCEHYCNNTVGSYKCACEIGYILQDNGINCSGLH